MGSITRRPTNLQIFLDAVTPKVKTHSLAKSRHAADVSSSDEDTVDFFHLGELWGQYSECSAYGVGVPVYIHSKETALVQYYTPSLSAIQIYTYKDYSDSRPNECSGNNNGLSNGVKIGHKAKSSMAQRKSHGHLYFEYFDSSSPHVRLPLLNKVLELAQTSTGLVSFSSMDISPASWMSVAWYPICHIPSKERFKDLSTCFLTYHKLSSTIEDHAQKSLTNGLDSLRAVKDGKKAGAKECHISLSPFGMATYKLEGTLWRIPKSRDRESLYSLLSAAEIWLKQLEVHHHDFIYFTTH